MNKLLLDIKYSSRLLAKSPAFTAVSMLIIVLGMALFLCAYSLRSNFGTKPLPYADGDRYVGVNTIFEKTGVSSFNGNFNGYAINYIRGRIKSFERFGAYRWRSITLTDGEYAQEYTGAEILPDLLAMTGVQPFMGRLLTDEDAASDAAPVVLIRYKVWENYFAADPNIIGTTTDIGGVPHTIIGVMPKNFDYPNSQHIWLPLDLSDALTPTASNLSALGKLKDGVTFAEANLEFNTLYTNLVEEYPAYYAHSPVAEVLPLRAAITPSSTSGFAQLLQILNFVILALVILNLTALLFVRAHTREKELAVRSAMGASGWQVAKQILLESLLICIGGLAFSIAIADVILYFTEQRLIQDATESDWPGDLSSWVNLTIDWGGLGTAIITTALIWLLSCAGVSYRTARIDSNTILAAGSKGSNQPINNWLVRIVISAEVIVSSFLLIVCCLLAAAIFRLYQLDYGTATDNYYTAIFNLNSQHYQDPRQRQQFVDELRRELSALSEFDDATVTSALPGQFGMGIGYDIEDRDLRSNQQYPIQSLVAVAPNYFDLLEVKLREGRSFNNGDNEDSLQVAIIDELLAQQLWPNESALGKRLHINPSSASQWVTIVGTTSHIIQGTPYGGFDRQPTLYRPITQFTPNRFSLAVKVKPQIASQVAEAGLRDTFKRLDRELALLSLRPLTRVIEMSVSSMRVPAQSAIGYAIATLIFAVIGIYGLIARSVILRTNEIGIRKALGSGKFKVLWIFLRQGLIYLTMGSLIGGIAALLTSNLLTTYFNNLFNDVQWILASVIVTIGSLILLASYIPARKVLALEPGDALRDE